jgi:pimeloyl-ACP methyl ester carboxylesterase
LLFHGTPGGRGLDLRRTELVAAGAWLFTLERPGVGLSDPRPGRTLLDWPDDVAGFADAFGLSRFAVIGVSGGAQYALASGHLLADRVTMVGLVCGAVTFVTEPDFDGVLPSDRRKPMERFRTEPELVVAEALMRVRDRSAAWVRDPEGFFDEFFGPLAANAPRAYWMRILAAAYGGEPDVDDYVIEYSPWGFSVDQLKVPIRAWHGDADERAPLALVEELVRRAHDAELTVYPGEGHFLSPEHEGEYLSALTAESQ